MFANKGANNVAKATNSVANAANNVASKAANNVADAANNVTKAANNVANVANNVTSKAANNVTDQATSIKDKVVNGVKNGISKVTDNMKFLSGGRIGIFLLLVVTLILFVYSLSYTYRVSKVIENMSDIYDDLILIDPRYIRVNNMFTTPLKNLHIATAYRPYLGKNQLFDYCSLEILEKTMSVGARCLYIDVFNSDLSMNSDPVVCNGFEKGNWKLNLNRLSFEDVIRKISNNAFRSGYVQNYNDPLFLAINLKTAGNHYCVDKVKKILVKYLKSRLLPSKYTNQQKNMANVPLIELMGKVVIFCSSGYQNTELEELVNASWDKDTFNQISFDSLGGDPELADPRTIVLDKEELKQENERNLCLVVPPEDSFFTYNYPTLPYFKTGCQFIAINYQNVYDDNTIEYMTRFSETSFLKTIEVE